MKLHELHELIAEVCPIIGINTDGKIWFSPLATDDEKVAAKKLMGESITHLEVAFP